MGGRSRRERDHYRRVEPRRVAPRERGQVVRRGEEEVRAEAVVGVDSWWWWWLVWDFCSGKGGLTYFGGGLDFGFGGGAEAGGRFAPCCCCCCVRIDRSWGGSVLFSIVDRCRGGGGGGNSSFAKGLFFLR